MSKLATIVLGGALALAPALMAQTTPAKNPNHPNNPAAGTATTGANPGGAATNGQTQPSGSNPATGAAANPASNPNGPANDTGSADRSMPNTAAGWLGLLFSGSTLSGAGLALRRLKK